MDVEETVKENYESVVILPPKDGEITDEDSDHENEGNSENFIPGNFSQQQKK